MCHGRSLNNKINYKLLQTMSIHIKNLQYLATELFKVRKSFSPEIMKEFFVFQENETYNLRSGNYLARKIIQTMQYGTECLLNLGAIIWNLLPGEIKKKKRRKWIPEKCP